LRTVVQQARRGLALGLKPELVLDGSGGTYFLRDARKVKVAVFKPADEEPYAENNPRGYIKHGNESLREGILPGEACLREVAAFLLDHGGFSGVPMTTLAEATHPTAFNNNGKLLKLTEGGAAVGSHSLNPQCPATSSLKKKVGSFQEFVKSECTMDDIGISKISADEIHKIAILDIRLMNADRNAANILCRRHQDDSIELVPIDHGYGLRDVCDVSWMDWCWLDWPQLKQPLSQKSKDYILSLDIDADAAMLKEQLNFNEKAIDYFRASSKLLQEGTRAGLTLYDIAIMCCRNDDAGEIPSKLEVLTSMASELATSAVQNGRWNHAAASKALADQLSPDGGSLLKHTKESSKGFFKSVSSINLVSFGADAGVKSAELPAMTQSTGSDTDTDSVDDDRTTDREDREEWAAGVIADVSLDHHQSLSMLQAQYKKPRSSSVTSEHSSDTALSSSPKGFWYTRPGSPLPSPLLQDELDGDSSTWSPNVSSSNIAELGKASRPSVTTQHEGEVTILTPTVTFAESFPDGFLLPPATVNISTFKPSQGGGVFASVKKSSSLIRSKSYSALSDSRKVYRRSSTISSGDSSKLNDCDIFKRYFNEFVDLVIVRETASLAKA
jgi:hypothetical protein